MNILVAYGSKYGSTAEIAARIVEVLSSAGHRAKALPASHITDLTPYDAVVVGSAVYTGHWTKEAALFLENHEYALRERPVWFFSSGPTGAGNPVEKLDGWCFPHAQQAIADRIKPKNTVLFHGKMDLQSMHLGERLVVKALGAAVGDFRDWNMITAWAHDIATTLKPIEATLVSTA